MTQWMKKTLKLFCLDWQRIFRSKLTFILMIALMVIPSLYAWFNIAALWDPYANTKDITIAVYSDDQTVSVLNKKVNIGDQIVENLKENETIGWQFVDSKAELDQGVKSGKFYGGIYLPKDFSANLVSFVDGEIQKPEINYSVNQKINAIAPKITDKGANTIKDTISQEFIGTVSETLLTVFNEVGFSLDDNLISIHKITGKLLDLDNRLGEIDGYTQEVVALNEKLPEFQEKLNKANEMLAFIPEVNQIGEKVLEVNKLMPKVKESGQLILTLEEKIPEIENAGKQIQMIDDDFDTIAQTLDDTLQEAANGLVLIEQAQMILPDVQKLAVTANQMIPEISASIGEIQTALPQIANGIGTGIQIVATIAQDIQQTTQRLAELLGDDELTDTQKSEIKTTLAHLNDQLNALSEMLTSTIGMLQQLQAMTENTSLDSLIQLLATAQSEIPTLQQTIAFVSTNVDQWSLAQLKQQLTIISQESGDLANLLAPITPTLINEKVAPMLEQLQEMLETAKKITGKVVDEAFIQQLDTLLTNTTKTVTQAMTFLEKYQAQLPAVKEEIHQANELLNGNMATIIAAIHTAADLYENELPKIEAKLTKAATFIQNDLPSIEADLVSTVEMMNEKMPQVTEALAQATTMIEEDWPNIRTGIHKVAGLVRQGQEDVNLNELIKLLKSDAQMESDFLSNPITIDQKDVYPVPNNGSASAPFYTALCLWVGAILFSSIAATEFELTKEEQKYYTKRQQFVARMGTFLVVALFQALIVSVGNHWLLGTYNVNPFYSVLFALLIGLAFMMMVYVLVALFGNLGKGAAIIILVLSISGGGGNYPVEMSGKFFQFIHPFLPFTYAVNLLRESVGGIYWPNTWQPILILLSITFIFGILGTWLYPKVRPYFKKLNEQLHEGKILH